MSALDPCAQEHLLGDAISDHVCIQRQRCAFFTRMVKLCGVFLTGFAVAMFVCVQVSGSTDWFANSHFVHRPNNREPSLWRTWAADDCHETPPLLLCRATCVMSSPLFPCMIQNDYPVVFSSIFFQSAVEQSQYRDRCCEFMFSWHAALEDSVGGVERGEGRVLSEVYLHLSTAHETTWTASFYGGNRFLRQRRAWAPDHQWTQCSCYFFTGRFSFWSAVGTKDLPGNFSPGNTTAATIIGGLTLSHLMRSSTFNLVSFLVGRPVQSWNQSIEYACAPYAAKCRPALGLEAASARNYFAAPPWRETYHKRCQ